MTSKEDETIEDMVAAGAFGTDSRVVSFKVEGLHTEPDQFATCVVYGVATVDDRDGRRRDHRLVMKYKQPTAELRQFCNNDTQFYNEILFYERIAPFLLDRGSRRDGAGTPPKICRYLYGRNGCGEDGHRDVVVLGNATADGEYRAAATGHKLSLDFDHLVVALRTLAKFHGLSYRAKREDSIKFKEIIDEVKDTSWSENGEWIFQSSVLKGLFALALNWLKERHVESGGSDYDKNVVKWIRQFESEMMDEPIEKLKHISAPTEPLAVLCHGDFNRNNILFRYDDSGRPVDALPYDMATIRYGSPAIDLSFILYLNADRQTRNDHWDALLDVYCATLAEEAGNVSVPNRNQIDAEMLECGFSGLVHVSFFARVMLEENLMPDSSSFVDADESKFLEILSSNGGNLATEWVADALHHFVRFKYARTPILPPIKSTHKLKYHE